MKINPKDFTLDALERALIVDALCIKHDALSKQIDRLRASRNSWTDSIKSKIERFEMERARASDLIGSMRY